MRANENSAVLAVVVAVVLLAAVLAVAGAAVALASPALDRAAARAAALSRARHFVKRTTDVDRIGYVDCSHHSPDEVTCRYLADGETPTSETSCGFRVVVRGHGNPDSVELQKPRCHTRYTFLLTAARARRAVIADAEREAGREVALTVLTRESTVGFVGAAEWTEVVAGVSRECSIEVKVELTAPKALLTTADAPRCNLSDDSG